MRWFKVATVALGLLIVFLVVSSVIGFLIEAVIAVLVVAVIALGIKAAFYKKQISGKRLIGRSADPRTTVCCTVRRRRMSTTSWPG